MGILDLFSRGPYMAWAKGLPGGGILHGWRRSTYQVVPSEHGLPMVRLDLARARTLWGPPAVANPDMTLAVIMDRSGSMGSMFSEGHAFNACNAILQHVSRANVGYDLVFYDDRVSDAGHIRNSGELRSAIACNGPRGGTVVAPAIRLAISKYRRPKKGIYLIVITDGEFNDKVDAEQLVKDEILPFMTPDDPYAFRLHFIGAGEGADGGFLQRIEQLATGQGLQLVSSHHHAHLSHSHEDILDELDKAFLGPGFDHYFGETWAVDLLRQAVVSGSEPQRKVAASSMDALLESLYGKSKDDDHTHGGAHPEPVIMRVGDVMTRRWYDGPAAHFGFLPWHAVVGLEFKPLHPPLCDITHLYKDCNSENQVKHSFRVPMPRISTKGPNSARTTWFSLLQDLGSSPEERDARAELNRRAQAVHEAELRRQHEDMELLSKGQVPVQARERLKELGEAADDGEHIFSSNLAPEEIALLRRHGFSPRGLVTGSAIYHVGQAFASSQGDCECRELSQAYDKATELAVTRMAHELELIKAHGVVGVRMNVVRHEWSEDKTIEVKAIGTAIEGPGAAPKRPWLSDLSGQEWFALHRAGYEPVGLVWGHCTWFVLTDAMDLDIMRSWGNREMVHWSNALSNARHIAMEQVAKQTRELGGSGVVGVKIQRRLDEVHLSGSGYDPAYSREHHNLLVSIIGTAIRPIKDAPREVPQTVTVLSLRDGRIKPVTTAQIEALRVED